MTPGELEALWVEPSHWNRDGSYKCAADPRLLVPKRNGGGWTLNMEHPKAQWAIRGLLIAVLGIAVALAFVARRAAA